MDDPTITKTVTLPASIWAMVERYAGSKRIPEDLALKDMVALGFANMLLLREQGEDRMDDKVLKRVFAYMTSLMDDAYRAAELHADRCAGVMVRVVDDQVAFTPIAASDFYAAPSPSEGER